MVDISINSIRHDRDHGDAGGHTISVISIIKEMSIDKRVVINSTTYTIFTRFNFILYITNTQTVKVKG